MNGPVQLALDLGHRPALGLDDFLVAPSNAAAVAWIDRWPSWAAPALAVVGAPGCGKSHLASVWQARAAARLVEGRALGAADIPALLGDARTLVVEAADQAPERPLLHLYNLLIERRGHILLTAVSPPARWTIKLADLRSRLLAAPVVPIEPPDEALIGAILVKLFADRQLAVGEEVLTFLITHMERSFEAARSLVARIDQAALAAHRRVTIPLVRPLLQPNP